MIGARLVRAMAAVALSAVAIAAAPPTPPSNEAATAKYFSSIRHQPSLLLAFPQRHAEGRRSSQPSVGRRVRGELSSLGRGGRTLPRDGDDVHRGGNV
jgi:hypothetical protein